MPEYISATFDSPDMADFALMRLRSEKIVFDSCDMEKIRDTQLPAQVGMIVNPYDTTKTTTLSNDLTAVGSIGQYGGFLFTEERPSNRDVASEEVRMKIRVHSTQTGKASAAIRSCHGRRITMES